MVNLRSPHNAAQSNDGLARKGHIGAIGFRSKPTWFRIVIAVSRSSRASAATVTRGANRERGIVPLHGELRGCDALPSPSLRRLGR